MIRLVGVVLLATSAMLVPIAAGAGTSAATPPTVLVLSVRAVAPGPPHLAVLRCDRPGGSHPRAGEACADLRRAGGDFDHLPGDPQAQFCTLEYRPVIASARGVWEGRSVRWAHTYGNRCALRVATGPVFDF